VQVRARWWPRPMCIALYTSVASMCTTGILLGMVKAGLCAWQPMLLFDQLLSGVQLPLCTLCPFLASLVHLRKDSQCQIFFVQLPCSDWRSYIHTADKATEATAEIRCTVSERHRQTPAVLLACRIGHGSRPRQESFQGSGVPKFGAPPCPARMDASPPRTKPGAPSAGTAPHAQPRGGNARA